MQPSPASIISHMSFEISANQPKCNAGDLGSVPGSGRSPGEGNGNLLQYSCLGNPLKGGAWQSTAHGVARVGPDLATEQQQ